MRKAIVFVMMPAIGLLVVAAEKSPEVPYPDTYRAWRHLKSVVVGPGHQSYASQGGKIFQFYANPQAVQGYQAGKFPNGSVIVRETLRAVDGEGESKGILKEGERSALDVMMKDDRLFGGTDGWGFETFDSKGARLAAKDRAECYACHVKQKDRDLVYSSMPMTAGTPYPEGYRQWAFLHSSLVPVSIFNAFSTTPCEKPCTAGVFHFYANELAMEGLRTGTYRDGAILAEEMLEWLPTPSAGAKEGQRRLIGVMVRDSRRFGSTGGWGYGMFDDGSRTDRLDTKTREACYQCHVSRKDQGYVFSEYRER